MVEQTTPIAFTFKSPTQPNRKNSQTTTLCCSPKSLNKQSFSTIESSSRRSSSTPLADRFMSIPTINNPITIITTSEQEISRENNNTPDSYMNDQQLYSTSCTAPSLYFLSSDPTQEIQNQQEECCRSSPKRKRKHHSTLTKSTSCRCCNICNNTHHHCCNSRSQPHEQKRKGCKVDVHQKPYISKQKKKRHQEMTIKIDDNSEGGVKREKRRTGNSNRVGCCCFIQKWNEEDNEYSRGKHKSRVKCFCYCGRREWVMFAFISLIVAFILAFVFWPRTPLIRIEGAMRTGSTKVVTQTQQGSERMMMGNVAFESIWLLNITMDNRRNYLPSTRFNRIQIFAKDAMTGLLIGKGMQNDNGRVYLPGNTISTVQLPISINYQARDKSDTTFLNLLRSCTNMTVQENQQHHTLPIQFWFTLYIFGLDWLGYKPSMIATPATGGFICPL